MRDILAVSLIGFAIAVILGFTFSPIAGIAVFVGTIYATHSMVNPPRYQ